MACTEALTCKAPQYRGSVTSAADLCQIPLFCHPLLLEQESGTGRAQPSTSSVLQGQVQPLMLQPTRLMMCYKGTIAAA